MELEELLERYEEEIYELWFKNKLKFLRYGCGPVDYKTIRDFLNFKPPKRGEKEAFIRICDIRIDRLKTFLRKNLAKEGGLIALFATATAVAAYGITSFGSDLQFLVIFYFLFILVFFIAFISVLLKSLSVNVQIHAWYAIKEGALLYEE